MNTVDELSAMMLAACIANPPSRNFIQYIQARTELGWPTLKLVQEPLAPPAPRDTNSGVLPK